MGVVLGSVLALLIGIERDLDFDLFVGSPPAAVASATADDGLSFAAFTDADAPAQTGAVAAPRSLPTDEEVYALAYAAAKRGPVLFVVGGDYAITKWRPTTRASGPVAYLVSHPTIPDGRYKLYPDGNGEVMYVAEQPAATPTAITYAPRHTGTYSTGEYRSPTDGERAQPLKQFGQRLFGGKRKASGSCAGGACGG